jgi:hypothetical protein
MNFGQTLPKMGLGDFFDLKSGLKHEPGLEAKVNKSGLTHKVALSSMHCVLIF